MLEFILSTHYTRKAEFMFLTWIKYRLYSVLLSVLVNKKYSILNFGVLIVNSATYSRKVQLHAMKFLFILSTQVYFIFCLWGEVNCVRFNNLPTLV